MAGWILDLISGTRHMPKGKFLGIENSGREFETEYEWGDNALAPVLVKYNPQFTSWDLKLVYQGEDREAIEKDIAEDVMRLSHCEISPEGHIIRGILEKAEPEYHGIKTAEVTYTIKGESLSAIRSVEIVRNGLVTIPFPNKHDVPAIIEGTIEGMGTITGDITVYGALGRPEDPQRDDLLDELCYHLNIPASVVNGCNKIRLDGNTGELVLIDTVNKVKKNVAQYYSTYVNLKPQLILPRAPGRCDLIDIMSTVTGLTHVEYSYRERY